MGLRFGAVCGAWPLQQSYPRNGMLKKRNKTRQPHPEARTRKSFQRFNMHITDLISGRLKTSLCTLCSRAVRSGGRLACGMFLALTDAPKDLILPS